MDWLKKIPTASIKEKRTMIDMEHREITVSRQCELSELSGASYYSAPTLLMQQKTAEILAIIDGSSSV